MYTDLSTRYLCMELLNICRTEPPRVPEGAVEFPFHRDHRGGEFDARLQSLPAWAGAIYSAFQNPTS